MIDFKQMTDDEQTAMAACEEWSNGEPAVTTQEEEAPENLYFWKGNKGILDLFSNKEYDDEVEYTRTDAFIKKACEAFCKVRCNGHPPRNTCTSLGTCLEHDQFRKALKGN